MCIYYDIIIKEQEESGYFWHLLIEWGCQYGNDNLFYFIGNDNNYLHKEIAAYSAK